MSSDARNKPAKSDMKPQKYRDDNPPEYYLPDQLWARAEDPDWVYDLIRFLVSLLKLVYRVEATGLENIPKKGAVIFSPNHFSFFDHFMVGLFVPRKVRFVAKSQMFDWPVAPWIFRHGGVFPICRGQEDEEAFVTARTIIGKEQPIVMYVQGGRSRTYDNDPEPKRGVGRLQAETGVTVIPVAIYGTQFLRRWKKGHLLPKILIEFGEPMPGVDWTADKDEHKAISKKVFARIEEMYTGLVVRRHRQLVARYGPNGPRG